MKAFQKIKFTPRSYILFFTFLSFTFAAFNLSALFVEDYNNNIADKEYEKRLKADGKERIRFSFCDFGAPKQHLQSRFINFTVFFICFFLLLKISFGRVFFSLSLQFLALIHYVSWFLESYAWYFWLKIEYGEKTLAKEFPFESFAFPFRYLQLSNTFDFIVLGLLIILFLWQFSILYCFVNEKIQAKISFR